MHQYRVIFEIQHDVKAADQDDAKRKALLNLRDGNVRISEIKLISYSG